MSTHGFKLYDREKRYAIEQASLAPYACLSAAAEEQRIWPEKPHPYRTAFQRDRDRIIHSRAFRRLKHKRQVFLTSTGDHYRTRLTHTMEVAQISRTIARALGLNEDLTEAIALGHDLGHTPFGHLGEYVLNDILLGKMSDHPGMPAGNLGGFKHNYQSLRIVDLLELKYPNPGLNLTHPVREGILKHTRLKRTAISWPELHSEGLHFEQDSPSTLEAQVVAIADEIAQRTHDLEDGLRAGLVSIAEVRDLELVRRAEEDGGFCVTDFENAYEYRNRLTHRLINILVGDIIATTLGSLSVQEKSTGDWCPFRKTLVAFSEGIDPLQNELNKFIYKNIIFREPVKRFDEQAREILVTLYQNYANHPEDLPQNIYAHMRDGGAQSEELIPRLICDHIAGMSDLFAIHEFEKLIDRHDIRTSVDANTLNKLKSG